MKRASFHFFVAIWSNNFTNRSNEFDARTQTHTLVRSLGLQLTYLFMCNNFLHFSLLLNSPIPFDYFFPNSAIFSTHCVFFCCIFFVILQFVCLYLFIFFFPLFFYHLSYRSLFLCVWVSLFLFWVNKLNGTASIALFHAHERGIFNFSFRFRIYPWAKRANGKLCCCHQLLARSFQSVRLSVGKLVDSNSTDRIYIMAL